VGGGGGVEGATLSGEDGLLFWRNSVTGAIEARPRGDQAMALNPALHAND
jgi:2,3,4,5-tetrahydropyridine-2,6-dicarboxylate N-succinyltransferase